MFNSSYRQATRMKVQIIFFIFLLAYFENGECI